MKFVVELMTKRSGRLGKLSKAGSEMNTPLVLHYTKAGSIPHLSREIFDMLSTEKQAIQISIETTYYMTEGVKLLQKGITGFVGLDPALSFATLRDTGESRPSYYSRDSVAISTRNGKVPITPEKYMDIIAAFNPDLFHTICDGDTNELSGNKRNKNAITRSETFFKQCAERYKVLTSLSDSLMIVPIEGGYSISHREETIKSLNQYENQDLIGGYFLDGFHNNGENATQTNSSEIHKIVERCNELLPKNKLKAMFGAYSPKQILELIQLNVDIFDTTYVYLATLSNHALTFSFNLNAPLEEDAEFLIDVSNTIFSSQFEPFKRNCTCIACKNHSRAYTHHLLNTKELLGPILLMIHNIHHYLEFFKVIRQCVADDALPTLISHISEQQNKYESNKEENERKQKESEDIISNEANNRPFKKHKNADAD